MPRIIAFRRTLFAVAACLAAAAFVLAGCGDSEPEAPSPGDIVEFGDPGRQPGQFHKPRAVAVTQAEELFVIDRTGRVGVYDPQTTDYKRQWYLPAWEKGTPTGISVDPADGTLWIADTHYQRILHYDADGKLLSDWGEGGLGPGKMIFPTDVYPDPNGEHVWVCEYGERSRIMQFTREGEFVKEWGSKAYEAGELQRPMALLVTGGGEIVVADAVNHRISVYGRKGEMLRNFGSPGRNEGDLNYPYDLALAPDGSLYAVEYGNQRISRFSQDGEYLGSFGGPGLEPGKFFNPWGLALSPNTGNLFIADTNNHRVQILRKPARFFRKPVRQTAKIVNGEEEGL